jgi:delta 1-pyrroline-5-carboxylate dehydrogenase
MGFLTSLLGGQTAPAPTVAPPGQLTPPTPAPTQGLISGLLGLSPEVVGALRSAGAGLSAVDPNASGLMALGQAMGGASKYQTDLERQNQQALTQHEQAVANLQENATDNARADKALSLQEQNQIEDQKLQNATAKRQEITWQQEQDARARREAKANKYGLDSETFMRLSERADAVGNNVGWKESPMGKVFDVEAANKAKDAEFQRLVLQEGGKMPPSQGTGLTGPVGGTTTTGRTWSVKQ